MQIGDLVRTKNCYIQGERCIGLIVGTKVWDLGEDKGKVAFLVQFVDETTGTWWTEEYLEVL